MEQVVLSLGTNLGDRAAAMAAMTRMVCEALEGTVRVSRLMETEPLEVAEEQAWYLNRLVAGGHRGTPMQLLRRCQQFERELGRARPHEHAARTADIDILLYGEERVDGPQLTVPHPRMLSRRFCLEGLAEIAGDRGLPGDARTFRELRESMPAAVRAQGVRFLDERSEETGTDRGS